MTREIFDPNFIPNLVHYKSRQEISEIQEKMTDSKNDLKKLREKLYEYGQILKTLSTKERLIRVGKFPPVIKDHLMNLVQMDIDNYEEETQRTYDLVAIEEDLQSLLHEKIEHENGKLEGLELEMISDREKDKNKLPD